MYKSAFNKINSSKFGLLAKIDFWYPGRYFFIKECCIALYEAFGMSVRLASLSKLTIGGKGHNPTIAMFLAFAIVVMSSKNSNFFIF